MPKPRIHLATVIGGYIKVLPHMLKHYRELGIDSIFVNVHLTRPDDPILDEVQAVVDDVGCGIHSASVYEYTPQRNTEIFQNLRDQYSNDWFILADQDELQVYGDDIFELVQYCERNGYDYVEGCLLDRVARDGALTPVDAQTPLEDQFPLGGFIGWPLLGAYPRKVVLSKGHLKLTWGQHLSEGGHNVPIDDQLVQVHHFKWVDGLRDHLAARAQYRIERNHPYSEESLIFIKHLDENDGRMRLDDERFMMSDFAEGPYKYWDDIKTIYKTIK